MLIIVIRIHVNTTYLPFGILLATEHRCIALDSDVARLVATLKTVAHPLKVMNAAPSAGLVILPNGQLTQ